MYPGGVCGSSLQTGIFFRAFEGNSIELISLRFISELPERFSLEKEGPHL